MTKLTPEQAKGIKFKNLSEADSPSLVANVRQMLSDWGVFSRLSGMVATKSKFRINPGSMAAPTDAKLGPEGQKGQIDHLYASMKEIASKTGLTFKKHARGFTLKSSNGTAMYDVVTQ